MSYAILTEPLKASGAVDQKFSLLPEGTEIRWISLENGVYRFDARVAGEWIDVVTVDDLPAYTDRGAAQRARGRPAKLRPGRPSESLTRPFGLRFSLAQRDYVRECAKREGCKPSEWIRRVLIEQGMPR